MFFLFFKEIFFFAPAKTIGAKDKIPSYDIDSASQENQNAQKKKKKKQNGLSTTNNDMTSPIKVVSEVEITTIIHKRPVTIQETKAATA